jgi:hypothetical protein
MSHKYLRCYFVIQHRRRYPSWYILPSFHFVNLKLDSPISPIINLALCALISIVALPSCASCLSSSMSFWKPGAAQPSAGRPNAKIDGLKGKSSKIDGMQGKSCKSEGVQGKSQQPASTEPQEPPRKLSKAVMGMNFMKQKEKQPVAANVDLRPTSVQPSTRSGAIVCVKDGFDVSSLLPGRRSFNGCNKFVENFYEQRLDDLKIRKRSKPEKQDGNSVSNEEMMKRYENLVGLPRGPNQGKRQAEKKRSQGSQGSQGPPEKKGAPDGKNKKARR